MGAAGSRPTLPRMSTLGIILIVIAAVLVLLFIGGLIGAARRQQRGQSDYSLHLAEADRALEQARAADKGWDRPVLEAAAREALAAERPGWPYDELALVLVDDKPGVAEDRAHFVASGGDGEARVVLARRNGNWALERVEY
jgi:cbb3-type cytochrome oxidase subunit 3